MTSVEGAESVGIFFSDGGIVHHKSIAQGQTVSQHFHRMFCGICYEVYSENILRLYILNIIASIVTMFLFNLLCLQNICGQKWQ
jgi:hypothetical protein